MTTPNSQLTVQRLTPRIKVIGSEEKRPGIAKELMDLLSRYMIELRVGSITANYLSLNLPKPLEAAQVEVINTIIQRFPHELKVDAPD